MSPGGARPTTSRSLPGGWGSAQEQQTARFHRERDQRRLLAMARALVSAVVLVALVLGVVGLRVQQVRLSYRLDGLRPLKTELEEAKGSLRIEVYSLKSPARIERKARELGMVPPAANQVQLAREFVPGGNGLSMAATPLTASADSSARSAPGVR
jgi:cell division protein FtsL